MLSLVSLLSAPVLSLAATPAPQQAIVPGDIDDKLHGQLGRVLSETAPEEFLRVTILLADQVDRGAVQEASAILDKAERRRQVVSMLQEKAAATQGPLLNLLEQGRSEGMVRGHVRELWIANVIGAEMTPTMIREVAARADVAWVHYDPPMGEEVLLAAPASPVAGPPLLPAAGGNPTCGLNLIGAPDVWSQTGITGQGVVVGVIDTGLCITHPDIANNVWVNPCEIPGNGIDDDNNGFVDDVNGWNFENNNSNIADFNGHGSHVSGTVAGDGTGGTQCGVAPEASIMTLRFWNSFAGEQTVWDGMQYGTANGADILTASLGWPHSVGPDRVTWRMVCENSIAAGVVVLYAAGNEGCFNAPDNVRTPGDVPDVITVGAVDCNDNIASFSSCGPVTWQGILPWDDWPYPPGLVKPDVSAPGVSTVSHSVCNGYFSLSGTSMATPHTAGLAALILQADPTLDHFGVKAILEGTSVDRGAAGKDNSYGSGRIDAVAAVNDALGNGNFCAAKDASCGSPPDISSVGMPSATANSGFVVTSSGLRALQFGMLIYGDQGPNAAPFQGGQLCVASPRRTLPLMADGSAGNCDGSISIDMNTFGRGLLGGTAPLPSLSQPGTTVNCQMWQRDPGNTFNVVLSAGLEYVVCP